MLFEAQLFHAILPELFPARLSKSDRRKIQIIDAAIGRFASTGIESTSFEDIAQDCGVSRALVQHYFPNREDLADVALRVIRGRFQKLAVDAVAAASSPEEKLIAYAHSTFSWIRDFPSHARVWLLFYYYCGIDRKKRKLNTELVSQGHARITALLKRGAELGAFALEDDQFLSERAKLIQNTLTGALLSAVTENHDSLAQVEAQTAALVLHLAKMAHPGRSGPKRRLKVTENKDAPEG
jgi:AcrR family transcriptional regulator